MYACWSAGVQRVKQNAVYPCDSTDRTSGSESRLSHLGLPAWTSKPELGIAPSTPCPARAFGSDTGEGVTP